MIDDDILNCTFIPCAFAAFVEEARLAQGWPDPELTRKRAFEMFETEKRKNCG